MRFLDIKIPEWMEVELKTQYGPEPTFNELIALLLKDYIKRNQPCEHFFQNRAFWDFELAKEKSEERCVKCGVKNDLSPTR